MPTADLDTETTKTKTGSAVPTTTYMGLAVPPATATAADSAAFVDRTADMYATHFAGFPVHSLEKSITHRNIILYKHYNLHIIKTPHRPQS